MKEGYPRIETGQFVLGLTITVVAMAFFPPRYHAVYILTLATMYGIYASPGLVRFTSYLRELSRGS